jgi:hypothetical protein
MPYDNFRDEQIFSVQEMTAFKNSAIWKSFVQAMEERRLTYLESLSKPYITEIKDVDSSGKAVYVNTPITMEFIKGVQGSISELDYLMTLPDYDIDMSNKLNKTKESQND